MSVTKIINNFLNILNLPLDPNYSSSNFNINILKNEKDFLLIQVSLKIKTDNIGKIIGYDGQNIRAIERILGVILNNKIKKHTSIRLKINNHTNIQENKLHKLADKIIKQAIKSKEDKLIDKLNAYERKIIHLYISKKKLGNITTRSKGDGKDRKLYIIYKKEYIDKDLDILGNGI